MTEWLTLMLNDAVSSGSVLVYVLVFVGGVVASFTPCTYPVLPLTVGYVGNAAGGKKSRGFFLSLTLVCGMALVYAVVGTIFAAIGMQFGAIWANGWAVFAIAWFFILMSLFLMDVFTFPVPRFLQNLSGKAGNRQGLLGAFAVGGVSGLVVGPCTGPILAIVIVAVTTTLQQADGLGFVLQVLTGGLKLFLFGLGQGTLILLCGTFAGLLAHLPKSGKWMVTLKKGFAMLVMAGASLLLVYVGQATSFPDLTKLLARTESAAAETPQALTAPLAKNSKTKGGDYVKDGVRFISKETLRKWMAAKNKPLIIDIMSPKSHQKAHIKGAVNIPLSELRKRAAKLDKNRKIVVYCANYQCHASTQAAKLLGTLGFKDVSDYKGGIQEWQAWRAAGFPAEKKEPVRFITRDDLLKLMQTHKDLLVIDVLPAGSYKQVHIKGAINIPLAEIEKRVGPWKKDTKIVVYCASYTCHASTAAAEQLMALGFKDVRDYKGGLREWKAAGLPVEGAE